MYLTGTPSRAATAAAMSGETPVGSPDGLLPVTSKKLPMLIAARRTPVGASSETTALSGISLVRKWWGDRVILNDRRRLGTRKFHRGGTITGRGLGEGKEVMSEQRTTPDQRFRLEE